MSMNPRILGVVMRELARLGRQRNGRSTDWEHVKPLVTWVAEHLQTDAPRLHAWFRAGLSEPDYVRYLALVQRLPTRLSGDERRELLDLTLRGLRLTGPPAPDADPAVIEQAGDEHVSAPVDAAGRHPTVVAPDDGPLTAFGMAHKIRSEWSDGTLAILETTVASGQLVPPHTHSREHEVSYVIAGRLTFEVGGQTVLAGAGAYVMKPRGVPHAFWNTGLEPARLMEIHAPGNLGPYYDAIRDIDRARRSDPERQAAIADLQRRYGITAHPERIPELTARYGVSP